MEIAKDSDLKLVVLDLSQNFAEIEELVKGRVSPEDAIIVLNKSDKPRALKEGIFEGFEKVEVSCLKDEGVGELKKLIARFIEKNSITSSFDDILVSARHSSLVLDAMGFARAAVEKIENSAPSELVASDVRAALESLGEIVGRGDREEVLDKIFSTFCIGK